MSSWSFSHFTTAQACKRKYFYQVLEKIPSGERSVDLTFGTSVHSGLNAMLEDKDADGEPIFLAVWRSFQGENGDALDYSEQRFNYEQHVALGRGFMNKWKKLHRKHYEPHTLEKRLYSEYKGMKLEGTADFIGAYKGENSLRDFKTASYNYPEEKLLTSLQLNVYSYLAIKELDFKPATIGYDVFNKSLGSIQNMTEEFSEAHMFSLLDDMLDEAEAFDKLKTYPRNTASCLYGKRVCDYYGNCFESSLSERVDSGEKTYD